MTRPQRYIRVRTPSGALRVLWFPETQTVHEHVQPFATGKVRRRLVGHHAASCYEEVHHVLPGRCRWVIILTPTPTGMPSPQKQKKSSTPKRKRLSQPVARELARSTRSKTDKSASDAARWLLDVAAKKQASKPKPSPKKKGRMFRSRIRKQCFFVFPSLFKTPCRQVVFLDKEYF